MNDIEIKMSIEDMNLFNDVYATRINKWGGKPDIHGYRNNPNSHAVGLWGELGVRKWLSHVPDVIWAGKEDKDVPDFMISKQFGIETKSQQPHNWTDELATTVQKKSYENWCRKNNVCCIVWTVCSNPILDIKSVMIKGWNTSKEVGDSGLHKIRGTQQYRTYPNIRQPNELIELLKNRCSG